MDNNDILRRIRYAFDFNDEKMIAIFGLAEHEVNREQISNWLKKVKAYAKTAMEGGENIYE